MKTRRLTDYRNIWLGFAMIWIMLHHSGIVFAKFPLNVIKEIGYGGVDICIFASGIGCYCSLYRDSNVFGFIKRRFRRLFLTYELFIVIWLIYRSFSVDLSFSVILGNVLGIQSFTGAGGEFNWYIGELFILYFLAPYFREILDQTGKKGIILTLVILILCSIPFWKINAYIIMVTRIPIFFMGMVIGKHYVTEKQEIAVKQITICILAMLLGTAVIGVTKKFYSDYLWSYGWHWYPFILVTPGLCMCISYTVRKMERLSILRVIPQMLETIGKNSFELYLLHIPMIDIFKFLLMQYHLSECGNWIWLLYFAMMPFCCILFKLYVAGMKKLIYYFK